MTRHQRLPALPSRFTLRTHLALSAPAPAQTTTPPPPWGRKTCAERRDAGCACALIPSAAGFVLAAGTSEKIVFAAVSLPGVWRGVPGD